MSSFTVLIYMPMTVFLLHFGISLPNVNILWDLKLNKVREEIIIIGDPSETPPQQEPDPVFSRIRIRVTQKDRVDQIRIRYTGRYRMITRNIIKFMATLMSYSSTVNFK